MLSPELIAKIAHSLEEIPPKPSSRQEVELLLTGIEKQIRAAQERGCSYADIAEQITASGYAIKSSTLRTAMQRRRGADAKSPKRRRGQSTTSQQRGRSNAAAPGRTLDSDSSIQQPVRR